MQSRRPYRHHHSTKNKNTLTHGPFCRMNIQGSGSEQQLCSSDAQDEGIVTQVDAVDGHWPKNNDTQVLAASRKEKKQSLGQNYKAKPCLMTGTYRAVVNLKRFE